ncbi:MAG: hypothetical protein DHS20C06_00240 [Hyphobacterium sp.]|nr:MAG: hypothetical protein DHS20C06_00240 [Hyphobacterium sp.]
MDEMNRVHELELRGDAPYRTLADIATEAGADSPPAEIAVAGIHHAVFYLFAGLFGGMILLFFLTFMNSAQTVFAVGVCTVYGVLFFGAPLALYRVSGRKSKTKSWGDFLHEKVDTNTGAIPGWAALVQICIVPVVLLPLIAFIGILITIYR